MEGVAAILECGGEMFGGSAKRGGPDYKRSLAGGGPWVRRKRRDSNSRGEQGQGGNRQALSGGTTRNGTGWLGKNPSNWKGAGSTMVETGTQTLVVQNILYYLAFSNLLFRQPYLSLSGKKEKAPRKVIPVASHDDGMPCRI